MYVQIKKKKPVTLLTYKNTRIVLYACQIEFNAFKVLSFSFPKVI